MNPSSCFLKRDDIRGIYPEQLNGETARAIGIALVRLLRQRGIQTPHVCIGHDCRHGNIELSQGLALGILAEGGTYVILGEVSTEHIYFACTDNVYSAGAMVTASHNPKEYNGIKFLHQGCLPFSQQDLKFIGETVDALLQPKTPDFSKYADTLASFTGIDKLPDAKETLMKVAVVAGNGMGGVAFSPFVEILKKKGIEATLLEATPNGDFPLGVPNPLLPEFMQRVSQSALEHNADLGIGFDGDADRAGFADASGQEIIPSFVLALIAEHKLAATSIKHPVVMRNLCCSQFIKKHFSDKDCEIIDTPVGHGRIKQLMRSELYNSRTIFAGEHSGHYFYPEFNYVDSGVTTSLFMISIALKFKQQGIPLAEKLNEWRKLYCWSGEINFTLKTREDAVNALVRLNETFNTQGAVRIEIKEDAVSHIQYAAPSDAPYRPLELPAADLKIINDNGDSGWWFVARLSGNEPKLRLNVEAWGPDAKESCQQKTKLLEAMMQ